MTFDLAREQLSLRGLDAANEAAEKRAMLHLRQTLYREYGHEDLAILAQEQAARAHQRYEYARDLWSDLSATVAKR